MRKTLTLLSFLALLFSPSVPAATLFWSGNGTTEGGAGTWDVTNLRFGTAAAGPFTTVWNNANSDNATLESTAGAITIGAPITINGLLQVNTTAYNFAASGSSAVTWGTGSSINVASGTFTLNNVYAGQITKAGTGTLSLNNSASTATKYTINAGTVSLAAGNRFGTAVDTADFLTLNGGGLSFNTTLAFTLGHSITLGASGGTLLPTGTGVNLTVDKPIVGTGGITIPTGAASSTAVILGNTANSFTGNIAVNSSVLRCGTSEVIPDTALVTVAAATFDLNNNNETIKALAGSSTSGVLALGAGRLTLTTPAGESFLGTITGTGGLTKNGGGTWTLGPATAASTFTGPTTNNAGILVLANASSGRLNIPGDLVINGGTVQETGTSDLIATTCNMILNGGTWQLGTSGGSRNQTTLKSLVIDNSGVADLPNSSAGTTITNGIDARSGSLGGPTSGGKVDGPSLTKTTSGTLTWTSRGSAAAIGVTNTTVNAGTVVLDYTQSSSKLADTGSLTVNGGSAVVLANGSHIETVGQLTLTSGSISNSSGTASLRVLIPGTFDVRSGSIGTVLQGSGALLKSTLGTVTLSGTHIFTGVTTVTDGTLLINGTTAAGSAVTVTAGTLGGSGTINGSVTVQSGGTISPGTAGIATLTCKSTVGLAGTTLMEINRGSVPNSDKISGSTGTITYGGTLVVSNSGPPLLAGDCFTLFGAAAYAGSFTLSLPALDPGLVWNTSNLGVNGTICVDPITIVLTCSTNLTVSAASAAGVVVNFISSATGTCGGVITVNCTPPSGSTFPLGTTPVTCQASDACGNVTNCSFQVTVNSTPAGPENFEKDNSLPPTNTVYVSPEQWHVLASNGIVVKDIAHDNFTASHPTPPVGGTIVHVFSSDLGFDLSTDNGATYSHVSATANCQVQVTHSYDASGIEHYDNEMQQLDFTVPGVMFRESPTLQSTGKTSIRQIPGGYMIASEFDMWMEVSLDGGATWTPAATAAHVEMRNDPNAAPEVAEPTPLLPPPQDKYVSPDQWHALFAQGIVIKDVSHDRFTQGIIPFGASSNSEAFSSRVDLKVSTDGGVTFQSASVTAPVSVDVVRVGSASSSRFDTEMTGLTLSGLPGGLMIRESPSLPSRGGTTLAAQPDGTYKIHSFFDIFPEVSTDGGATWSPTTNGAVRMHLKKRAPETAQPTSDLPPPNGNYVSPADWHALYAQGIILTNVSHSKFTQSQPPPPAGSTNNEIFGSQVTGQLSTDGGATFQSFSAPANVDVVVASTTLDSGTTRFFDTEMLTLDVSGGSLPPGVMIRESPTRASLGRTSIRPDPALGGYRISSFFDIFTEISLDNGGTWFTQTNDAVEMTLSTNSPNPIPLSIACPSNITVTATSPAGAVVFFTVATSGGCAPVNVVVNPPSGSTFPIGTTVVTATATDGCGGMAQCTFSITVKAPVNSYFFPQPLLPPINSTYISPAQWHVLYNNGIVIRDVRHRDFTQHFPLPPLGTTQPENFNSFLEFDLSTDNGATFAHASASAQVTIIVHHSSDDTGGSHFDTEMLQLDMTIPGSPPIMLRESPTLQSKGQTTVRQVNGGFMIDSFFDIFTEISLDGGASWTPANDAGHVEVRPDPATTPAVTHPTDLLPPPNGGYVSPQQWHALFAQGIVIKDVSHKFFTQSYQPPTPGNTDTHSLNSTLNLDISLDGGASFQSVQVAAPVTVSVTGQGSGSTGFFDTEMLQLDVAGLPAGVMIRESPTLPSRGVTQITSNPDGSRMIGSFFDIFPEVSTDGGASWSPATNGPVRMQLSPIAPEIAETSPNLPPLDGNYVSPAQWHALYANGIIITNASHDRFTQTQPPPPPGGNQTESFGSRISGMISMDGGATFQPFQAPAGVQVHVASTTHDTPSVRFFETEMLALSLSGGTLPGGVMVRESPSKASLGRTSVRTTASGYMIDSFFDVFTEVSLDGGATWSPTVTAPGTMGLNPPPTNNCPPLTITCPADITVYTTSPAGAVVFYTVGTSGGCPPVNVVANPPSGSTFPVGTTTVTATATDAVGNSATCSFKITVKPPVNQYFFPTPVLPPQSSVYVSPALWHALYANGIVIRDVRHRFFLQSFPPPPPGTTQTHTFGSEVDFDVSFDNGATFNPGTGNAQVTVQITHSQDAGGQEIYDTEMLQLDLTGSGFMLRESPTLQSKGQTTVRTVPGGYLIGSFFDVFTEISTDGGVSWQPANQSGHVELRPDPSLAPAIGHPTRHLPPPTGAYISPQLWHALFAQGIVIRDVRHKIFTQSYLPPSTGSNDTHTLNSQLDMQVSTDGGSTWTYLRAPATMTVGVGGLGSAANTLYDTEMLSLDATMVAGGLTLQIRESPTLPSRGGTQIDTAPDGSFRLHSFFDIFPEISLDGGATWSGATNGPVRMHLTDTAPEVAKPNPNLPPLDGNYVSPQQWHALYANGIIITNASHDRFTQTQPPPPPGGSQTENFGSRVTGLISMNGGASFQPFSAPASVAVQVTSRSDQDTGPTRFFDTEMLSLSLQGGNLPGGVMVRESPSKASLGRTSVRTTASDYRIGSFFDIFTEVSLDGGQTWSPGVTHPGTMGLGTNGPNPGSILLTCSSNITLTAAMCSNSAVVFFTSSATSTCPPVTVTCTPPSGSTFPLGTTTVTCTASDACGNSTNCSFTVTVNPFQCAPLVLTCSTNITVTMSNCGGPGGGVVVFYNSSATGGCLPPPNVQCNPPSGSTFPLGATTVTCTATDGCGNSTNCSFTVTVNPCPSVVLACSSNIVVTATNCGAGAGAVVTYSSSVSGGCGPAFVSCNPPSGSTFPVGTTLVTCSAFDCGVVVTNCSFSVTVKPQACAPIVLTCSTNITVSAGCSNSAVVFYSSSATGGCAPTTVNCNPPSGSAFPIGTNTVTCTATDGCGNSTNCSFKVTVTGGVCPPLVLHCSTNIVVPASTPSGAIVFFTSTVTGGCPPVTLNCVPPSGSFFPIGTSLVICHATDGCGNATNCEFSVRVVPTIVVVTNVLPATNVVYVSPALWHVSYANGIVIRDIRHRKFTNHLPPPILGASQIHTFSSELDYEMSTDGGATWQPVTTSADCTVKVTHTDDDANGTSFFDTEMLAFAHTNSNGTVVMIRESPSKASLGKTTIQPAPGGYSISSFFDIFTEVSLDNGATWTPADDSGHVEMRKDPREDPPVTEPTSTLPAPNDAYVSPQQWHALYAQGIVISNVSHKFFTQALTPPPPGGTNQHTFNSVLDLDVSLDGGQHFQSVRGNAPVTVNIESLGSSATSPMYDTEMSSLTTTIQVGGQPLMIRESPTRRSQGEVQMDQQPDGSYRIGSFFDIFPEISLDGGNTWAGSTSGPVHMQLTQIAPEVPSSGNTLPITNQPYVSPQQWHAAYANGIYISNVTHRGFTQGFPPPPIPGGSNTENFGSTVDMQVSLDGGHTFQPASASMSVAVAVVHRPALSSGGMQVYDTEMLSLDMSGGNLPGGVRIRESPTKQSLGRTSIRPDPQGGFRIGSFFDIFTEISMDNGNTWMPQTNRPALMAPRLVPHKRIFPLPNIPPTNGQYISPKQWHALYANGIIVSNVSHKRFLANMPPPPPRSTNVHNFGSIVTMLIKLPGQPSFIPVTANADCQVSVGNSGFQSTEKVFQNEMLSLNVSGGTLPPGVMIRESPSKASRGETHYQGNGSGARISSFFDIWTEVSMDGGQSWIPADSASYMELHIDPGQPPTTIVNPRIVSGVPTFTVQSQPGLRYLLQYKNDLDAPTWTTTTIMNGNGEVLDIIDCCPPPGPSRPHRFYRVEVQEDDTN